MTLRAMLVAFVLCTAIPPALGGYVYRWTEDGVEHFSDVERSGAERLWVPDDARSPVGAGTRGPSASADPAAALKDPKSPEFLQARCDQRSKLLEQLTNATKLVQRDADGFERDATPEEREKALASARADVEKYCAEAQTP